jgi:hypothetical protein
MVMAGRAQLSGELLHQFKSDMASGDADAFERFRRSRQWLIAGASHSRRDLTPENSCQALQFLAHSLLGGSSNDLVLQTALVENEQGGHGPHAVLLGQLFVILHVYSGNFDGDGPVHGDGFKHRRHGLARIRPVGPKFDYHGLRGVEHFPVEVRFV